MRKSIVTINANLKNNLDKTEQMIRKNSDRVMNDSLIPVLAEYYLLFRECEDLVICFDKIRAACLTEVSGTYQNKTDAWKYIYDLVRNDELSFTIQLRRYITEILKSRLDESTDPSESELYNAAACLNNGYENFLLKLAKIVSNQGSFDEILQLVC